MQLTGTDTPKESRTFFQAGCLLLHRRLPAPFVTPAAPLALGLHFLILLLFLPLCLLLAPQAHEAQYIGHSLAGFGEVLLQ